MSIDSEKKILVYGYIDRMVYTKCIRHTEMIFGVIISSYLTRILRLSNYNIDILVLTVLK